jgi:hypothetical protein
MRTFRPLLVGLLGFALAAGTMAPAGATSLIRQDLSDLVTANRAVVVGEVLDVSSYWNADGTFILTDVRVGVSEVLKGSVEKSILTLTLMGGTVGDLTTLIVGGPELTPGGSYLLFVNDEDLPGAPSVATVRDHVQGVFDVVAKNGELRAVSQAARFSLLPDHRGLAEPPGGTKGLALDSLSQSIRQLAGPAGGRVR